MGGRQMFFQPYFSFIKLQYQKYFSDYVTPRDFKKGARDIPFGMGAISLYVDDVNGHDHNDGESWKTPLKTIQAAVDAAESWTTIYVSEPTTYYNEDISIDGDRHHLSIIGKKRALCKINSSSWNLNVAADNVLISGFALYCPTANVYSVRITTCNNCILNDISIEHAVGNGINVIGGSGHNLHNIITDNCKTAVGIGDGASKIKIRDSYLTPTIDSIALAESSDVQIHDNVFASHGLLFFASASECQVFHNNFLSSASIASAGSNISSFENYFSSHSNIDNGFGIATEPYTFSGGSDPRPVVCRNGWNSISIQRAFWHVISSSGTLNDANLSDEITTTQVGQLAFIGISLVNLVNGDDFDVEINRWNGSAWLLYKKYVVTKVAGVISIDSGSGATPQFLEVINLENIYFDSTRKLQLKITRNSGTDRNILYWYNLKG